MKSIVIGALLAACLSPMAGAQVTPPATAQQQLQEIRRGDPPRWYQEDRSKHAQLATLRKEIRAALNEALEACRQGEADERSTCAQRARITYHDDMANVQQLHAQAQDLSKVYETSGQ